MKTTKTIGDFFNEHHNRSLRGGVKRPPLILKGASSKSTWFVPLIKVKNEWVVLLITKAYKGHFFYSKGFRSLTPPKSYQYHKIDMLDGVDVATIEQFSAEIIAEYQTVSKNAESAVLTESGKRDIVAQKPPVKSSTPIKEKDKRIDLTVSTVPYKFLKKDFNHPKWQRKKCLVFIRDEFCCRWCGEKEMHLKIWNLAWTTTQHPWDWVIHNLVTVCDDCYDHARMIHANERIKMSYKIRVFKIGDDQAILFDDSPRIFFSDIWMEKGVMQGTCTILKTDRVKEFAEWAAKLGVFFPKTDR